MTAEPAPKPPHPAPRQDRRRGRGRPPVAVVTGGSRGLGRALAAALSRRGWALVLDARGGEELRTAAAGLPGPGPVRTVPGSVADAKHRAELITAAVDLGGLDLLVNNAGVLGSAPLRPLADHPLDGFRTALEVNATAALGLIQAGLPLLRESRGAIMNVSSEAAAEAYPTWGGYGAAKAALDHLSAVLAEEEPDVRVWAVDPGGMRTALHAAAVPDGHLTDLRLPEEVVPAFLGLLARNPASGRYSAAGLLAGTGGGR